MEKFVVTGGKPLSGEVTISGAKNAAVAIIPAVILCDEPCQIENIPNISDVSLISRILQQMGANVDESTVRPYILILQKSAHAML